MRFIPNPFEPFSLRGLLHQGPPESEIWTATLCLHGHRVAQVASSGADGAIDITVVDAPRLQQGLQRLATPDACPELGPGAPDARLSLLVDHLAQMGYLDRRVDILSHRHLVYQLREDPPTHFRCSHGGLEGDEPRGLLRLAFGRRLVRMIARGQEVALA